jgi:hypothetical protein
MVKYAVVAVSAIILAACQQTAQTSPSPAPAAAAMAHAATTQANPFVGAWRGTTERGGSILLDIPASGSPRYVFRGENVPIQSTRMSGNSMLINLGAALITLTPSGSNQLDYVWQMGSQRATARLSKG